MSVCLSRNIAERPSPSNIVLRRNESSQTGSAGFVFVALDGAHLVDNALEDALQSVPGQRPLVLAGYVMENVVFALRLVDGQRKVLFNAPDLFDDLRALVQKR